MILKVLLCLVSERLRIMLNSTFSRLAAVIFIVLGFSIETPMAAPPEGYRFLSLTEATQLAAESELFTASTLTEDFREGVSAFLEKRPASFHGR